MDDLKEKPSRHEKEEAELLDDALRQVLSQPSGKRVLFWVLEQCSIYGESFTGDNDLTNFIEGKRSIGRKMIDHFNAMDPLIYPTLLLDMAKIRIEDQAIARREAEQEQEEDDNYI